MANIRLFGFNEILQKARQKSGGNVSTRDDAILRELTIIAEEACNRARDTYIGGNPDMGTSHQDGGYDDHTRNLRGSIGFNIYHNGKLVAQGGFDGRGSTNGEATAKSVLANVSSNKTLWEIVVVAGMHYARYVEAKGFPVITFVQDFIDQECKKLKLEILKGKI